MISGDWSSDVCSSDLLPTRLDGGAYVQLAGERRNGFLRVAVVRGGTLWIPEIEATSGEAWHVLQ